MYTPTIKHLPRGYEHSPENAGPIIYQGTCHGFWLRQGSPISNFQDALLLKNGYTQGLEGHNVLIQANITLPILVTIMTIITAPHYQVFTVYQAQDRQFLNIISNCHNRSMKWGTINHILQMRQQRLRKVT